jgi:hypothetical protein
MSPYLWSMRSASVILFVFALIAFVATLAAALPLFGAAGEMGTYPELKPLSLLVAFGNACLAMAWPLFGAALLWRIDQWRGVKSQGAAE